MTDSTIPRTPRLAPAARGVLSVLRAQPFSVLAAVVTLALASAQPALFGTTASLLQQAAVGYEPVFEQGHWWTLLTWTLFAPSIALLIVDIVLIVALVGVSERLWGTWRTVVAYFATAVSGTILGLGLQLLGSGSGEFWTTHTVESIGLDPLTPVLGALMAASGSANGLWRRRIRVIGLLAAAVLLLYSGQPADLYRLLAALIGIGVGVLLRSGSKPLRWARGSRHEVRVLMSSAVAIMALGPVIALFTASRFGPLAPITLLLLQQAPDATDTLARCQALNVSDACVRALTLVRIENPGAMLVSVAPMVLLLIAAQGLLRGRRFAVWLAAGLNLAFGALSAFYFGLLPVSGLPGVIKAPTGTHWEVTLGLLLSIGLPLVVGIALILLRRNFPALPPRRRLVGFTGAVAGSAVALAAAYVGGGLLVRDVAFTTAVGLPDLLGDVVERFLPVAFLRRETVEFLPATPTGALLYYGIGPLFWTILIVAAVWVLAGESSRTEHGTMRMVRERLTAGGGDSLSFLATWPGNAHWFDPASEAVITYRVVGGVALTIGGPFGITGSKEPAMSRFARYCTDNGWTPVFYSIDGRHDGFFRSLGWRTMMVAEETVLRPGTFQMTGKKWQPVRTSISRAERAGVRAVWTSYAALPITTAVQLAGISEQWVADKGLPEMGFTLGGLDELRDPAVRLMLAIDENGTVHGVTSWLPTYRDGRVVGWTLDFMRRRADSINGVMEFLIAETAQQVSREDVEFLSLSGAPLAHTATATDTSGIDRILAYISASLEPLYGFRSLLRFKRKFQPEFHPLLMAYPDPTALPAIGVALARAYLPGLSLKGAVTLARGHR